MKASLVRLIQTAYRFFFHLLYHEFAFLYDFVALSVSLGMWTQWIETIIPFLDEEPILELGFGTGYLQQAFAKKDVQIFGIDESAQMIHQAKRKITHLSRLYTLVRSRSQSLPFSRNCFHRVVASFPSEYIFHPDTLREIKRVLKPGGKFVMVPAAWITGTSVLHRLAAGLFRVTRESPETQTIDHPWIRKMINDLTKHGFKLHTQFIDYKNSRVLVVIAEKPVFEEI